MGLLRLPVVWLARSLVTFAPARGPPVASFLGSMASCPSHLASDYPPATLSTLQMPSQILVSSMAERPETPCGTVLRARTSRSLHRQPAVSSDAVWKDAMEANGREGGMRAGQGTTFRDCCQGRKAGIGVALDGGPPSHSPPLVPCSRKSREQQQSGVGLSGNTWRLASSVASPGWPFPVEQWSCYSALGSCRHWPFHLKWHSPPVPRFPYTLVPPSSLAHLSTDTHTLAIFFISLRRPGLFLGVHLVASLRERRRWSFHPPPFPPFPNQPISDTARHYHPLPSLPIVVIYLSALTIEQPPWSPT